MPGRKIGSEKFTPVRLQYTSEHVLVLSTSKKKKEFGLDILDTRERRIPRDLKKKNKKVLKKLQETKRHPNLLKQDASGCFFAPSSILG